MSKTSEKKIDPVVEPNVEKVIVTYKGSKYDITNFVKKHPGGRAILLQNNGKDIEQPMLKIGHTENAYKTLEKYKITEPAK